MCFIGRCRPLWVCTFFLMPDQAIDFPQELITTHKNSTARILLCGNLSPLTIISTTWRPTLPSLGISLASRFLWPPQNRYLPYSQSFKQVPMMRGVQQLQVSKLLREYMRLDWTVALGYGPCRTLTGPDFQSVFNLHLWASNAKLINYYMFYGSEKSLLLPYHLDTHFYCFLVVPRGVVSHSMEYTPRMTMAHLWVSLLSILLLY